MRLFSTNLEKVALKSIMAGDDRVASWILPRLSEDHFSLDSTKETYNRMMKIVRKDGDIPRWDDIIEDMAISQDTREELTSTDVDSVSTRKLARKLVDRLDEYRRVRVFFNLSLHVSKIIKADKVDLDELTDQVGDYLFRARTSSDISECMLHVGDDKLDTKFVANLLIGREQEFIPTGFKAFDSRNQGVPRGSLFLIAGTTGGGKTVMANNIGVHQARIGARVCIISLEMSREHNLRRILSSLTEIPLSRINNAKSLSQSERKDIMQAWINYHKQVKRNGGRLTLMSPEEDVSMEDVLTLVKPYEYDNKIIDYVGLLKGMDGEDQWRRLGSATRFAARDASATDSINTVLAQLSNDGLVKYSRAMQEHAALSWQWSYVYGDEVRESKIITIKQPKARQLQAFDFHLQEKFDVMKMVDLDPSMTVETKKSGTKSVSKNTTRKQSNRDRTKSDAPVFQM
jgi:hypothetical protein